MSRFVLPMLFPNGTLHRGALVQFTDPLSGDVDNVANHAFLTQHPHDDDDSYEEDDLTRSKYRCLLANPVYRVDRVDENDLSLTVVAVRKNPETGNWDEHQEDEIWDEWFPTGLFKPYDESSVTAKGSDQDTPVEAEADAKPLTVGIQFHAKRFSYIEKFLSSHNVDAGIVLSIIVSITGLRDEPDQIQLEREMIAAGLDYVYVLEVIAVLNGLRDDVI